MYYGYSDYVFYQCTVGTVNMYSSSVLWVQKLCILVVYCGYSDYVLLQCTVGTVNMYSSCVMWIQ